MKNTSMTETPDGKPGGSAMGCLVAPAPWVLDARAADQEARRATTDSMATG